MTEVKQHGLLFAPKLSSRLLQVCIAAMLCTFSASAAQAVEIEVNSTDASALARTFEQAAGDRAVTRTISLGAMGEANGIEIGALNASGRFEINLPSQAVINQEVHAFLQLDQTQASHIIGEARFNTFSGSSFSAPLSGRVRGQDLALTLPISAAGVTGFDFEYGSNAVCTLNEGSLPTFAVTPISNFTYRLDQSAVTSVSDAARTLGDHVTITLPGDMISEAQFATAFQLARALEHEGRVVSFNRLPGQGFRREVTSASAIEAALAEMLASHNSAVLNNALAQGRGDAVLAYTLLAASGAVNVPMALGDIVIASTAELENFANSFTSHRQQLSSASGQLARALRHASLEIESVNGAAGDITILRAGYRPVIALTNPDAVAQLATYITGRDGTPASVSSSLSVQELNAQADIFSAGARSEWNFPLSFDDLPAGTSPRNFEIALSPGSAANVAGQLVHVFLNDQLLRTFRIGSNGEARRFSVGLPSSLLSRDNDLRVLLQRDATRADCNENQTDVLAQLLPSSGISLVRATTEPEEFFQLAPYFRGGVDVALREVALSNPVEALNGLRALAVGLLPHDAATQFHFVPEGMSFAPRGSFLLYGVDPAGLDEAPIRFDRGDVAVNDHNGAPLVSLEDMPDASVVQIVQARGFHGLWVNRPVNLASASRPSRVFDFDRGNLALVDAQGIALWVNAGAPRGPLVDYVDQHFVSDFFAANRLFVLITVWSLLTLLLLRVVLSSRTKQGKE